MLSVPDQIAADLVAALNAAEFTGRWQRITAQRFHYPQVNVSRLNDLVVAVYPQSIDEERQTRGGLTLDTYAVSIACMLRVQPLDNESSDHVRHLAGEIRGKIKVDAGGLSWFRTEWNLFVPEELAKKNLYMSVVTGYWR